MKLSQTGPTPTETGQKTLPPEKRQPHVHSNILDICGFQPGTSATPHGEPKKFFCLTTRTGLETQTEDGKPVTAFSIQSVLAKPQTYSYEDMVTYFMELSRGLGLVGHCDETRPKSIGTDSIERTYGDFKFRVGTVIYDRPFFYAPDIGAGSGMYTVGLHPEWWRYGVRLK